MRVSLFAIYPAIVDCHRIGVLICVRRTQFWGQRGGGVVSQMAAADLQPFQLPVSVPAALPVAACRPAACYLPVAASHCCRWQAAWRLAQGPAPV